MNHRKAVFRLVDPYSWPIVDVNKMAWAKLGYKLLDFTLIFLVCIWGLSQSKQSLLKRVSWGAKLMWIQALEGYMNFWMSVKLSWHLRHKERGCCACRDSTFASSLQKLASNKEPSSSLALNLEKHFLNQFNWGIKFMMMRGCLVVELVNNVRLLKTTVKTPTKNILQILSHSRLCNKASENSLIFWNSEKIEWPFMEMKWGVSKYLIYRIYTKHFGYQ